MITAEEDAANESIERAMKLLDAQERIFVGSGSLSIEDERWSRRLYVTFALVMGISEYNFSGLEFLQGARY